jgi:hypothetical protein
VPRNSGCPDELPSFERLTSKRHRLVYLPIGKVACSTIKQWMLAIEELNIELSSDFHQDVRRLQKQHSLIATPQILRDPAYVKFMFVRDPHERLVSAFVDKFVFADPSKTGAPAHSIIERIAADTQRDRAQRCTFREFINYLVNTPDESHDGHWRAQAWFAQRQPLDFLGTVRHIERDLETLRDIAGIGAQPPVGHLNPRRPKVVQATRCHADTLALELSRMDEKPPWDAFYDKPLREIVHNRFAKDFDLWEIARNPDTQLLTPRDELQRGRSPRQSPQPRKSILATLLGYI